MVRAPGPHTTTTTRRRRTRAVQQTLRGQFTSDRPIPPVASWWVGVSRAEAVAAHEPRWRRTELSTPPRGE